MSLDANNFCGGQGQDFGLPKSLSGWLLKRYKILIFAKYRVNHDILPLYWKSIKFEVGINGE